MADREDFGVFVGGSLWDSTDRGLENAFRRFGKILDAKDVLERLVSLEPRDLSIEAKVEKCRATRDLRGCGRTVQHILISCGHASLCAECGQRCDVCPICRVPLTGQDAKLNLRLFDQCIEAGLLILRDDDFKEREGTIWSVDVQRLWSFFDIALENNLVSLICDYVIDVCLDEDAVSSDPVVSMLLDGAVVKEWCRRTFSIIVRNLRDIYSLGAKLMQMKVDLLDKLALKLMGISHVLDALGAPACNVGYAPAIELNHLLEGVQRVSQHLGAMSWCARHRFLDNIQSRHATINNWRTAVRERKSAAFERAWPDYLSDTGQLGSKPQASLFIEDALLNLGLGREPEEDTLRESLELGSLRQGNVSSSPSFRSRREGSCGQVGLHGAGSFYPTENVRATVDLLFLEGTSDLFMAKKAIFLYYLFDRHWTIDDAGWKSLLDDYAASFNISRQAMLESLVFLLLDDTSEQALEEACRLLPDIANGMVHPKLARVLLERQKPDAALWILRCSSHYPRLSQAVGAKGPAVPSLSEAVTGARVRLECGLLTEAYLYQRSHCAKVKAEQMNRTLRKRIQDGSEINECRSYLSEMEVLVGEICWLCIYRNLVDRMVELPWECEEENVVHKCLMEHANQDPSSSSGSFMVVFYLQRCRYVESYLVHRRLCTIEQHFISSSGNDNKNAFVTSACQQRTRLVEKSVELLPEIQVQQLRSGALDCILPNPLLQKGPSLGLKEMDGVQPEEVLLTSPRRMHSSPFSTSPSLSSTTKNQSMHMNFSNVDAVNAASSTGWGDFRQPSILHGRPFKSSGGSSILSQFDSPFSNGPPSSDGCGRVLFSPILGRRLRYDGESSNISQAIDQPGLSSVESMPVVYDSKVDVGQVGDAMGTQKTGFALASSKRQHYMQEVHASENANNQESSEFDVFNRGKNGAELLENGSPLWASVKASSTPIVRDIENRMHFRQEINPISGDDFSGSAVRRLQDNSSYRNMINVDGSARGQLLNLSPNGKRQPFDRSWLDFSNLAESSHVRLEEVNTASLMKDQDSSSSSLFLDDLQRSTVSEVDISRKRPDKNEGARWRKDDCADTLGISFSSGMPKAPSNMGRPIGRSRFFRHHAI